MCAAIVNALSDVDENRRKLKVAIRPLTCAKFDSNINNVEDIRASVEALRLSPSATVSSCGLLLFVTKSNNLFFYYHCD